MVSQESKKFFSVAAKDIEKIEEIHSIMK